MGERRESKVERASVKMSLAKDMLLLHLPLIQSALGQKVEAKLVGLPHQERSQRWAAMLNGEVACPPGSTGLLLGWSRSNERVSPLRMKFALPTSLASWVVADADGEVPTAPVLQVIMSGIVHVPLTDEVPRRPVPRGRVSLGYKSHTKGLGHASEAGRVSPQPRLKGCQQRQSRGLCGWFTGRACSERQNLRVLRRSRWSMRSVSATLAATKWPAWTSSGKPVAPLRNGPLQPTAEAWRFVVVRRNQHGLVSHC